MRFWNAAALTANPWLRGDEAFRLLNLNAGQPELSGRLPALRPVLSVPLRGGARQRLRAPMILDGVQFDLRPQMARDGAVGVLRLIWRISFPWPDRSVRPELMLGALEEAA